ncbi:MAG: large conductance mechanosensitive channel protein MscL [Methylobacteriaceae bacterium]|nr:large conductance mechanosensitive channel protein MscL [Methylobacteriaceae bacterium]
MLSDFRKFALRGNVIDLAIGVIIGAAFSKIVDSLVNDIIMPLIGAATGGLDFSNYYLPLTAAIQGHPAYLDAKKAGAVLGYGQFLTVAINFLIIAFILFLVVREIARLERMAGVKREEAGPTKSEILLTEIRDLLAKR